MAKEYALIRWTGVNTLNIVNRKDSRIDEVVPVGSITNVYWADKGKRPKAYQARILGYGSK